MQVLRKLIGFGRKSPRDQLRSAQATLRYHVIRPLRLKTNTALLNRGWRTPRVGSDRTVYVIGLFGSGRWYINRLLLYNIGERANYFRDTISLHPGPTSMIYSGHATIRHTSRLQYPPEMTNRILEAVRAGFADLIFIYRHPLDSLLTNWVWWRMYVRENKMVLGISEVYSNTDDLCADLERHYSEFEAFAKATLMFLGTYQVRDSCLFKSSSRKLSFSSNPQHLHLGLRIS